MLLRQVGLSFRVAASHVPEDADGEMSPPDLVKHLARLKASEIARTVDDAIVIGADTIVVLDGAILGKPSSPAEARDMLKTLSGRTHRVYTGFSIMDRPSNRQVDDHEVTEVTFRRLDDGEIDSYVKSGSPMDKAGAYGIQDDYGAIFVEKINGCFYNVVGFPLTRFHLRFREFTRSLGLSETYHGQENSRSHSQGRP